MGRSGRKHDTSLVKAFIAGSLSGTCSTLLFQPFDLVKTRLQVEGTALTPAGRIKLGGSNGMLYTFYSVARREHVVGLWRGLVPSLWRCVPGIGMYFCALHGLTQFTSLGISPISVKEVISGPREACNTYLDSDQREERTMGESVILGACARTLAGITLLPVTVVKTRFESGCYGYNSMRHALMSIWKREGGKGLYSGLLATVARDAPFSGLYLMFYTEIKRQAKNELGTPELSPFETFLCGAFAGIMASVTTQPADVVKTRIQLFPHKYSGTGSAVFSILKTNGVQGLLKGLVPRTLRRTLMAALSWTVYERLSRELGLTR